MRTLLLALALAWLLPMVASAAEPSLEQRVADIEAYFNNAARVTDGKADSKISGPGPGHNGWMMISSGMVLFMTLPGLALFYGGLVRSKNVLSVVAQCMGLSGLVTILWWAVGYSLCFAKGGGVLGGFQFALMNGVGGAPNPDYAQWVSHNIFFIYQMMFAIITPALIVGAIAERMKFSAVMLFCTLWMFLVYFPIAHMLWGADGMMNGLFNDQAKIKAIDFAGGIVVHMTSGWSALALCVVLGKRHGFGKEPMPPHSMVLCAVGTGMLWVGWYGFNAGSALAADGNAGAALIATHLSAATAGLVWAAIEWKRFGRPSMVGLVTGVVAGLATVTPASGFVGPLGGVVLGAAGSLICYQAVDLVKHRMKIDDSLDVFAVHGVGGILGTLLVAVLAATGLGGAGYAQGVTMGSQAVTQVLGVLAVCAWSGIATLALVFIVRRTVGLRAGDDAVDEGLDMSAHGERAYNP